MADHSAIEWCDATWNPTVGCDKVSAGCTHCYAITQAYRLEHGFKQPAYQGLTRKLPDGSVNWTGVVRTLPERLAIPLTWKKPARIFVDSMSDLFHEDVPDEFIDRVFGVMALAGWHTYQILTKRPERMLKWATTPGRAEQVWAIAHIAQAGRLAELFAEERLEPVKDWPGYWVSNWGTVYSDHRGERRPLQPMSGEQGHSRVTLYRDGEPERPLIHRLVLEHFDRRAINGEQGCHINGNPRINALWNLRWGSQSDNWDDSKRHGTRRRYSKLDPAEAAGIRARVMAGEPAAVVSRDYGISDTQARNIATGRQWVPESVLEWPLPSVWLGTSVEDQGAADERIPLLLQTPAAVRFLSCEPLLGLIDLRHVRYDDVPTMIDAITGRNGVFEPYAGRGPHVNWVIAGGESGPKARPCDPAWVRSLRDQCQAVPGVALYFKQWGGRTHAAGGRLLDGRTWDQFPEPVREPAHA